MFNPGCIFQSTMLDQQIVKFVALFCQEALKRHMMKIHKSNKLDETHCSIGFFTRFNYNNLSSCTTGQCHLAI